MEKFDVFISYSRKDSIIANEICEALESAGLTFFIDRQGIGGGFEFPAVIADAICDSRVFLFLASENSYQSKFTNNEITFAFNEKPRNSILPYIIDRSELPRHIKFVFAGINWRNIMEHPIKSVLIPDILRLLNLNKPKIPIKPHLNKLQDLLQGTINFKTIYSSVIQLINYKKIPDVGVVGIGMVKYGNLSNSGYFRLGTSGTLGIKTNGKILRNITAQPLPEIVIETLRRNSEFESDYEIFLGMIDLQPMGRYITAKAGDIVAVELTGIALTQMNNVTHLYSYY